MHVVSINVGRRKRLEGQSFKGETGIFKKPVTGRVRVTELGLENDAILNQKHHGGPDQAVYIYRQEDYDWWTKQLGRPVGPGTFGDNLTVVGLPEPALVIGSRLEFDNVALEVTAPRIPCNTLAQRMDDAKFIKLFVQAERPGNYCRVIGSGEIETDDAFTLSAFAGDPVSTLDLFRGAYRKLTEAELQRFLSAPLDIRTRTDYLEKLKKLQAAG